MDWLAVLVFFLLAQGRCLADDSLDGTVWQQFERRVRDGEIGASEARAQIAYWAAALEQRYSPGEFDRRIFFPLKDYGLPSIGGRNGEGYRSCFFGQRIWRRSIPIRCSPTFLEPTCLGQAQRSSNSALASSERPNRSISALSSPAVPKRPRYPLTRAAAVEFIRSRSWG